MVLAILYFAIGFAVAGLLAIILAPIAVRRAIKLTRRQVEASLPISVDEIRAEKDKVRAELAVVIRRLEMDLDKAKRAKVRADVKAHRAEQAKIEFSDKYEAIVTEFGGVKARLGKASSMLFALEKDHKAVNAELNETVSRLAVADKDIEQEQARVVELENNIKNSSMRVEELENIVAEERQARKNLADELREVRATLKSVQTDLRSAERGADAANKQREKAERRAEKLDEKLLSQSLMSLSDGQKSTKADIVNEALHVQKNRVSAAMRDADETAKAQSFSAESPMPKAAPLEVKSFIDLEPMLDNDGAAYDLDALKHVLEKIGVGEAFDRKDMENHLQQIAALMSAEAMGARDIHDLLSPFLEDAKKAPEGSLARAIVDAL